MNGPSATRRQNDDSASDPVLCPCANLTRSAAGVALAADPAQSFDRFLTATGSGGKCTACMLDLEHFFVETPRVARPRVRAATSAAQKDKVSLKRRLYGYLDQLPPRVPTNRSNWMPVLYGRGVTQYLWLANHSMLYQNGSDISEFEVGFTVRDSAGRTKHKHRDRLKREEMYRHNLSQYLGDGDSLSVGSIQIDRYASYPGVRGTSRPQIEVLTGQAASSLHFQAATPAYNKTVTVPYRPNEEQICLTAVNCADAPFTLEIDWAPDGRQAVKLESISLDAYESRLIETKLPKSADSLLVGRLLTMQVRSRGLGKLHLLCADADFSRISLDHL